MANGRTEVCTSVQVCSTTYHRSMYCSSLPPTFSIVYWPWLRCCSQSRCADFSFTKIVDLTATKQRGSGRKLFAIQILLRQTLLIALSVAVLLRVRDCESHSCIRQTVSTDNGPMGGTGRSVLPLECGVDPHVD